MKYLIVGTGLSAWATYVSLQRNIEAHASITVIDSGKRFKETSTFPIKNGKKTKFGSSHMFDIDDTSIEDWLKSAKNELATSTHITLLSGDLSSRNLFAKKSRLALPVPTVIIRLFLLAGTPFSLKARNLHDALKTITTIETIQDEV